MVCAATPHRYDGRGTAGKDLSDGDFQPFGLSRLTFRLVDYHSRYQRRAGNRQDEFLLYTYPLLSQWQYVTSLGSMHSTGT